MAEYKNIEFNIAPSLKNSQDLFWEALNILKKYKITKMPWIR